MNEKLKKLLDLSTFDNQYGGCVHFDVDYARFSELVVIECAEFIEQDQGSGYELAIRLKKYFGIEK